MPEHISELKLQIDESIEFIRNRTQSRPRIAIILGTGLGGLVKDIDVECSINYSEIPNFVLSTVEFHSGKLIFGQIAGIDIVVMQGRFHYYEGYTMHQITFPVRVLKYLGADYLFVSNACGSVNPYIRAGNIMIIDDHINLLGSNPLIGSNDESIGPRFPDMSEPYSKELMGLSEKIALRNNIKLFKGVYAAMTGPSLETRAEYRMLRNMGADVVGMSTIPENIVANHMGMKVLGLSIVTDECYPEALEPVDIDLILENAAKAEPDLTMLFRKLIPEIK